MKKKIFNYYQLRLIISPNKKKNKNKKNNKQKIHEREVYIIQAGDLSVQ